MVFASSLDYSKNDATRIMRVPTEYEDGLQKKISECLIVSERVSSIMMMMRENTWARKHLGKMGSGSGIEREQSVVEREQSRRPPF